MRVRTQEKRTAWRGTVRVIAVMFLLLAFGDLAFPQICGEDNAPLFPAQRDASAVATSGDSGEPHPEPMRAEDCFCCCSHIVAEDSGSPLGQLAFVSGSLSIAPPTVPLAPVRLLFHPPRLA